MNKLKYSTVYLAGPIQYADDSGVSWRKQVKDFCDINKIRVFDPTNKPAPYMSEIAEEIRAIQDLIQQGKFQEAHEYTKDKVVKIDLRMVDLSDFVIGYIDPDIHTCGSYHEIFHAWEAKKPVLIFIKGGRKRVPAWLLGIIKPEYLFDNLEDLLVYVSLLNKGLVDMDVSKWILFNGR